MTTNRAATPRLPGVFFPAHSAPPSADLPPLDVAAFVGFAERGPLDLPVALEDADAFAAIFGGDLPLARGAGEEAVLAQLPGAVADFFANGGRRCYVVRVACRPDDSEATVASPGGAAGRPAAAARFVIPGLAGFDPRDLSLRPASLDAASPGRWAGRLALAARLEAMPLPLACFVADGPRRLRWVTTSAPAALRRGDLLRLGYADGRRFLAPVADIVHPTDPRGAATLELAGLWEVLGPADAPAVVPGAARLLGLGAPAELTAASPLASDGGELTLVIAKPAAALARGDLIELDLPAGRYLLGVQALRRLAAESPPEELLELRGSELLAAVPGDLPEGSPPPELRSVERLRLGLQLRLDAALRPPLVDLGLGEGHPRFWGDEALRGSSLLGEAGPSSDERRWPVGGQGSGGVRESLLRQATPAGQAAAQFRALAAGERPPAALDQTALAALLAPLAVDQAGLIFLPVGMPGVLTGDDLRGPAEPGNDGLGRLSAGAFLDPGLRLLSAPAALLSAARERYDVQEQRLLGVHSLLVIDEVALIAAPDAGQRPWEEAEPAPLPDLPAAGAAPVPEPCPARAGPFIDCERAPLVASVSPGYGPLAGGIVVAIGGSGFAQQVDLAVRFGDRPAAGVEVVDDGLLRCVLPAGAAPEAVDATVAARGGSGKLPDGFTYQAPASAPELPLLPPASAYDLAAAPLLEVHRALLAVCQARRDALALLALPAHYTRRECIAWQQELRSDLELPIRRLAGSDGAGGADLSYAAVFHPWLLRSAPGAPGRMRAGSPEGAVAGTIAARERERGVWVAPANLPLAGALGLAPQLSDDDWAELFALQFNLLRREARDFRAMSAHTLSDERALIQISVRRLLIVLRKAALIHGMEFVFQSNHDQFREGARALLNRMLLGMYERGAFAGSTPEQAYRVDTGPAVNPPQSVEQGRFVAEIRVAPSQPAEFISVVLINAGGQLQAAEGR